MLAYARSGILEGVALRYFNVFGPRQSPSPAYAAVIPVFLAAALNGTRAPLNGDGGHSRDFTYIDNVVNANLLASERTEANGWPINVGAGERTSLLRLLELVREVTGAPVEVEQREARVGDVRHSLADLSRGARLLGYAPTISLREGLRRTWSWFRDQSGAQ